MRRSEIRNLSREHALVMGRVNKYYQSLLKSVKEGEILLQMQILSEWGHDLEYAMRFGQARHEFKILGIEVPK